MYIWDLIYVCVCVCVCLLTSPQIHGWKARYFLQMSVIDVSTNVKYAYTYLANSGSEAGNLGEINTIAASALATCHSVPLAAAVLNM